MSLIICPECGNKISSLAEVCPSCGYPVSTEVTTIIVKATNEHLGIGDAYIVYDDTGSEVARLRPGESFSKQLPNNYTTYFVKRTVGIDERKEMVCEPNVANSFVVGLSPLGYGFNVTREDFIIN